MTFVQRNRLRTLTADRVILTVPFSAMRRVNLAMAEPPPVQHSGWPDQLPHSESSHVRSF